jgi:hypothetical protein
MVADLEDATWLLQECLGADGDDLAKAKRAILDAPHTVEEGSSHGLQWRVLCPRMAPDMGSLRWFDQDERSIYLAQQIREGWLSDATTEEHHLAHVWRHYAQRRSSSRPRFGLREDAVRAEERAFLNMLRDDWATLEHPVEQWSRLDEERTLPDGSSLIVEREGADGGHFTGCYVVSRYLPMQGPRGDRLVERTYLSPSTRRFPGASRPRHARGRPR